MFPRSFVLVVFAVLSPLAAFAEVRTWTDKTGEFKVEAEFVSALGNVVKLQIANGRVVEVPLDQLSDPDRDYLQQLRKSPSRARGNAELAKLYSQALALYTFDGADATTDDPRDAIDLTGKAAGAIRGAASRVPGVSGRALKFDGRDDFVQIPELGPALRSDLRQLSISLWLKQPKLKLGFAIDVGHYGESVSFQIDKEGARFLIPAKAGGLPLRFQLPQDSQWHHYALVWDGRSQAVYIDGMRRATAKTTSLGVLNAQTLQGPSEVRIGSQTKRDRREQRFYAGELDEVGLFTTALTPNQIALLRGLGKPRSGLAKLVPADAARLPVSPVELEKAMKVLRDAEVRMYPEKGDYRLLNTDTVTEDVVASLAKVPKIDHLYCRFAPFTDSMLGKLVGHTEIRRMHLGGTQITDKGAALLAKFPNLEMVDLSQTAITDKSLRVVAQLKKLKDLDLHGTEITNRGLMLLSGLTALEDLSIDDCEMLTSGHTKSLSGLTKLRILRLFRVGGGDLVPLAKLTNLEELTFRALDAPLKHDDMQALGKFTRLTELELSYNGGVNDQTIVHLKPLKNLIDLRLNETQVGDGTLEFIAGEFPLLHELQLANTPITDNGLLHLSRCKHLKEVDLSWNTSLSGKGIAGMKGAPIQRLMVEGDVLTDEDLKSVAVFKDTLTTLGVSSDPLDKKVSLLTSAGMAHLEPLQKLTSLHIAGNEKMNDAVVPHLIKLKSLRFVICFDTKISDAAKAKINKE